MLPIYKQIRAARVKRAASKEKARLSKTLELDIDWTNTKPVICPACYGIGMQGRRRCPHCKGSGTIPKQQASAAERQGAEEGSQANTGTDSGGEGEPGGSEE